MSVRELRPELVRTVGHIAARWPRADTEILKYAFPLLAEGRPVSVSRLAQAAGTSAEAVEQTVVAGRVELDDNGDIGEVFGSAEEIKLKELRHGFLLLLAYDSPLGPFEFGYGLAQDDFDRLYVNVGLKF